MQIIEERIPLAKDLDCVAKRGEDLGRTDAEKALTPLLRLSRAAPFTPPPAWERDRSGLTRAGVIG